MSEHHSRPHFDTGSLAYGQEVIGLAAADLRHNIFTMAEQADADVNVEIKADAVGVESPVTKYDKAAETFIGNKYQGTAVRIKDEEQVTSWPDHQTAALDLHVDPIDGTQLFIKHAAELIAWARLPKSQRPPHPISGPMVSAGAVRPGEALPQWGAIAAPFLSRKGIVQWSAGPDSPAVRTEPGQQPYVLPHASELGLPDHGGTVLVASGFTERIFAEPLQEAGFQVVKYDSTVAAALSVMDPELFEQLQPGTLEQPIVGILSARCHNWDVAGVIAIANDRGHFVRSTDGSPRTFEDGARSLALAAHERIGRTILQAIAATVKK